MQTKKISQVEARRLKKRVEYLERIIESNSTSYSVHRHYGTEIAAIRTGAKGVNASILTALKLKHEVVVRLDPDNTDILRFYAANKPRATL